jgi:hypothetical protein
MGSHHDELPYTRAFSARSTDHETMELVRHGSNRSHRIRRSRVPDCPGPPRTTSRYEGSTHQGQGCRRQPDRHERPDRRYDTSQSEPSYMPGMDAAGVIDEVGEGSAWNIGDEVMAIALPLGQHGGAHAEYLVARDNATPQLITPGQGRSGDSWDHADRPGGHDCRGSHQHPLPGVCRGRARGNEGDRDVRRGTPRRDDHSRLSATCNHDASRKS